MINTKELKTFEDIHLAKQEVKMRLKQQEVVLEQHFRKLPKALVGATFKGTLPAIVPALISSSKVGTALNVASGVAGFLLARGKAKQEQNVLKRNMKQSGVMLLTTLAGSLLKKIIK